VAKTFFLDTNVFIYSVTEDDTVKSRIATQLIRRGLDTHRGVISYQVVQEFYNLVLKRFADRMNPSDSEEYLEKIFRPMLRIHSSVGLYQDSIALQRRYKLSWYDSLIVAAAAQAGCSTLYTEDLQHGQRFGDLEIENPFG
jgi:predicted nucleic acid-binding protein